MIEGRKKILLSPLDWGLGHATRCVPIIRQLVSEGHEIILATSGQAEAFLRLEFPELEIISAKGYGIRYPKNKSMSWVIFLQTPKIIFRIFMEHQWLKKIVRDRKIDEIISDNCYGLWNKNISNIFITHQLMIKCPYEFAFLEKPLHRIICWFISQYDECWIPDVQGNENLSGDLSHKYPLPKNAKFIGWLSRFEKKRGDEKNELAYDLCILLSGPEPQRSILEKKLVDELIEMDISAILVQGIPGKNFLSMPRVGLRIVSHLDDKELKDVLLSSNSIICRAGYSSIMDLTVLGKKACLVPTPGQTEQEYLAEYLSCKGNFDSWSQETLSLKKIFEERKQSDLRKELIRTMNPIVH